MSDTPIYDQLVRDFKIREQSYRNPIMEPERKGRAVNLRKKPVVKTLAESKTGK